MSMLDYAKNGQQVALLGLDKSSLLFLTISIWRDFCYKTGDFYKK